VSDTVIEFPGREPPSEGYSEQYIDKLHSEAFRELESALCDCTTMAKIAGQMVTDMKIDDDELVFAVYHVSAMLDALKANYYAAWHGERQRVAAKAVQS
jgi:hypothetical protein